MDELVEAGLDLAPAQSPVHQGHDDPLHHQSHQQQQEGEGNGLHGPLPAAFDQFLPTLSDALTQGLGINTRRHTKSPLRKK